jgi:RNA polymerase sigma factor (sigma-70 family)
MTSSPESEPEGRPLAATNVQRFLKDCLERAAPDAALTADWEDFHKHNNDVVRSMARRWRLSAEDEDDLCQIIWMYVVQEMPKLDWAPEGARLRGWLQVMIRNKALNMLRSRRSRPDGRAMSLDAPNAVEPSEEDASLERLWDGHLLERLIDAMEKGAPEHHRRMLRMRWIEGRPVGQIAAELDMSPREVTDCLQYRYRKLRIALAWYRGDPIPMDLDNRLVASRSA